MDNNETKQISDILKYIYDGMLGRALRSTRSLVDANPHLIYDEELESIENDYRLMLDYMKRGFNDPQRGAIYQNLIVRLYRFTADLNMAYRKQNVQFFAEASGKASRKSFNNDNIKAELEGFVTDVAMLSLDPEPERTRKSNDIYRRHNDFTQSLFCHIVTSRQWGEHDAAFFEELLLSPAVDTIDAQLIISALTLATMNNMDANKFSVMMNVYLKTTDEHLRQKALIGWAFALSSEAAKVFPKLRESVSEALNDKNVLNELVDLQKQMVFCLNAEQDTATIRRDIMPELMKNNNLNITRFGITEKEDDPMADIFDPGASERAMEKMEESFQKMMNMQKAGSDIYFGGFSQMKRFPFFYNVANWFCPFYLEHPEISSATSGLKDTPLLANVLSNGPFCDSDKYSFTLALSSVISRLPANMKEMFNSQEALGATMSKEEQESPAYIRRMILQDMYRFFRLFQQRGQLLNPFETKNFVFITNDLLDCKAIRKAAPDLCFFMIKHKNKEALGQILAKHYDDGDTKLMLANGIYELNMKKNPDNAITCLEKLNALEPENKRAESLLARAYYEKGDYTRSAECYGKLYEQAPENKAIALNYCVAMAKAERYDNAVNLLYKLDIETPGSTPVLRVLAWTLMGLRKYEQAGKYYNRILNSEDVETGDWLNAGYCDWLSGDIAGAAEKFGKFINTKDGNGKTYDISKEMEKDKDFLASHGISSTDMQLMADLYFLSRQADSF